MSVNWQADLMEAHRLLCPEQIGTIPAMPSEDVTFLRMRLIDEEHDEFRAAMYDDDIPGAADALADLIYVAVGTAVAMGIDLSAVWDAVHASNLAKAGGVRRADGKFMKPISWVPPDIAGILARQCSLEAIYPEATR